MKAKNLVGRLFSVKEKSRENGWLLFPVMRGNYDHGNAYKQTNVCLTPGMVLLVVRVTAVYAGFHIAFINQEGQCGWFFVTSSTKVGNLFSPLSH